MRRFSAVLLLLALLPMQAHSEEYNHPGAGNFLELGLVRNESVFGYKVHSPYGVARLTYGRFELMQTHVTYFALQNEFLKIGPVLNYAYTPYGGSELPILEGMSRSGYFEAGVIAEVALPFGRLEWMSRYPLYDGPRGIDHRVNYASALPALKIDGVWSWVNFQYELGFMSPETSTYYFGVRPYEARSDRSEYSVDSTAVHSLIVAYWAPVISRLWLTATLKHDWYSEGIVQSPLVSGSHERTILFGLLWSFGNAE